MTKKLEKEKMLGGEEIKIKDYPKKRVSVVEVKFTVLAHITDTTKFMDNINELMLKYDLRFPE